jgi:Ca2+-transporting ATPase
MGELFEGFVILFIVVVNAIVGVVQEDKAEACIAELRKSEKTTAKVLRDGYMQIIPTEDLVVGDIVYIEAGDIVPADIRLIESNNLKCDESKLTGESLASAKDAHVICKPTDVLAERNNMAYSGSLVTMGKANGVIVSVGNGTEIGKIAHLLFKAKKDLTPLQKSIEKARTTTLPRLIYGLGIANIGLANAKVICKEFRYDVERMIGLTEEDLNSISGIGPVIAKAYVEYFSE